MSKDWNQEPEHCKYCGKRLDIDSLYQHRQYHKWDPHCTQYHNQFLGKMRKARESPLEYIRVNFINWADKELANGATEKQIHPLVAMILTRKHRAIVREAMEMFVR